MYGYVGKILRVDLTSGKVSALDTKDYVQYGGGHGMGSALFWEFCRDKAISGFDPRNVVTLMTSPLAGTFASGAGSRCEVQGIGVQGYPIEWFTRSNFGGNFAAMLKFAGWDGIVLEGKASKPVWLNIVNDSVTLEDAAPLWGLDTWATQEAIWKMLTGVSDSREWVAVGDGRTTQKPAVVAIGPAGEHLNRSAALVHGAGSSAGQGGFGGVWGSKQLKAISVWGTGGVKVADPAGLIAARKWLQTQAYNQDAPLHLPVKADSYRSIDRSPGYHGATDLGEPTRPTGCLGCNVCCRRRTTSGLRNESQCVDNGFYTAENPRASAMVTDWAQKLGINVFEVRHSAYLRDLYKKGILGPGKQIPSELPWDKYGTGEFGEAYLKAVAYRQDIGADLAEGALRCAKKWGRLEADQGSGALPWAYWGYHEHYDPRLQAEWSYGSILGDRELNEHDILNPVYLMPKQFASSGEPVIIGADKLVEIVAKKLVPFCDPMMLNFSAEGIYSEAMAKLVYWHRHYSRSWKQSMLYCDNYWPGLFNLNADNMEGPSPEAEPMFLNAVTGQKWTFLDGMELGRKNWNLDRAIWVMQGRHRDQEVQAPYAFNVKTSAVYTLPVYENGQWRWDDCKGRMLDRTKLEEWKSSYYKLEGWDVATGWPTRESLNSVGLDNVADELARHGKLGSSK